MAGSSTGLNDAIEAAYKAGIPVVTISSSVTSPYAINVDSNYARWGYDMAASIQKALGGKGNVLMVEGIAGAPIVALERAGAEKAFKGSDIKEARSVNGNWTANVTKTAVLQALATTPQKIDAVWTTGSESRVVAEAFAEANRPQPLITGSISGDALGYWKAHPDGYRFEGQAVLPGWNSQALFRVAVRLLEGQQPKLGTLLIPIPAVHQDDLGKWYEAHDLKQRCPSSRRRRAIRFRSRISTPILRSPQPSPTTTTPTRPIRAPASDAQLSAELARTAALMAGICPRPRSRGADANARS